MLKADGSVLIHSDGGSYKPLNWMSPPCTLHEDDPTDEEAELGVEAVWRVVHSKVEGQLRIRRFEIDAEQRFESGNDPGLIKNGIDVTIKELLAHQYHIYET